jgi:sugar transferase (PEP-CTERM/EpsH1 system associated)
MAQRISQALRSRQYDRILVFSSSMAQYVERVEPVKILDLVDVDSDKWEQYAARYRGLRKWLWREEARRLGAYESKLVQEFSATLVCTDAEAALLRSKAEQGNIEVLENFLDTGKYDPEKTAPPERVGRWQPYIVFTGSMDYFPNIDAAGYFIHDVLPLIRREMPDVRFVIAGRNPHRSILKLASRCDVQLTGSVLDIRPYICGAAVAVVPMRIARGVQNKVLEALAGGVPVVSTSAAAKALPDSLQSLLSVADSPGEFAGAVVRILRHGGPVPQSQMRAVIREHIKTLDLPRRLEMLLLGQENAR